MLSKSRIEDATYEQRLSFGELYFWADSQSTSIHSMFISSQSDLITDYDLNSLINFLNKDVSKLSKSIMNLIYSASQLDTTKSTIQETLILITQELTDWHSYFKYNCGTVLLNIIANYISNIIIYSFEYCKKNNTETHIPAECSNNYLFSLISPIFNEYLSESEIGTIIDYYESIIKQTLQTSYVDYRYITAIEQVPFGPLDEFERLQSYITKMIPQNRPDRNRYAWDDFITAFCKQYGPLSRQHFKTFECIEPKQNDMANIHNEINEVLKEALSKSNIAPQTGSQVASSQDETSDTNTSFDLFREFIYDDGDAYLHALQIRDYYKYTPKTFTQFIQAQLIQLSESSCTIKFCPDCLQFFLQKPNIKHKHNEYIKDMINIQRRARQKVYNQYHLYNSGDSPLEEYDLYQFHRKVFETAIKQRISPPQYEAYVKHENYTHDKYKKLPPI